MANGSRVQVPDVLRQALDVAMADRDNALNGRLGAMEGDLDRVCKMLTGLMHEARLQEGPPDIESVQVPVEDKIWQCQKCGARLGFYDPVNEVMRLRYKEHVVYTHAGLGGWVRTPCRQCGELNVVEYVPAVSTSGAVPEIQVAGDLLALDEPFLAELTELVKAGEGTCTVRLVQAPAPDPH